MVAKPQPKTDMTYRTVSLDMFQTTKEQRTQRFKMTFVFFVPLWFK